MDIAHFIATLPHSEVNTGLVDEELAALFCVVELGNELFEVRRVASNVVESVAHAAETKTRLSTHTKKKKVFRRIISRMK